MSLEDECSDWVEQTHNISLNKAAASLVTFVRQKQREAVERIKVKKRNSGETKTKYYISQLITPLDDAFNEAVNAFESIKSKVLENL